MTTTVRTVETEQQRLADMIEQKGDLAKVAVMSVVAILDALKVAREQ